MLKRLPQRYDGRQFKVTCVALLTPTQVKRTATSGQTFLQFKHGFITITILTKLTTPFSKIITEVLSSLSARYPDGLPTGSPPNLSSSVLPIPSKPQFVRIATLHDPFDSNKGFHEIPWVKFEKDNFRNSPAAFDIGEQGVLAFVFTDKPIKGEEQDEEVMEQEMAEGFWVEWPWAHVEMSEQQLEIRRKAEMGEGDGDGGDSEEEREMKRMRERMGR